MGIKELTIKVSQTVSIKQILKISEGKSAREGELIEALASYILLVNTRTATLVS